MQIWVYASDQKQLERLNRLPGLFPPDGRVEFFRDVLSFHRELRRNLGRPGLLLLLIATVRELSRVVRMADLMDGRRIILVLPDLDRATVALGHRLYPRFVSSLDGDLQDVRKVMAQMIEHLKARHTRY